MNQMLPVFDREAGERKDFFFTKRIVILITITRVTYHNFVAVTSAIAGVQSAKRHDEKEIILQEKIILKVKCCSLSSFFHLFVKSVTYIKICRFLFPF